MKKYTLLHINIEKEKHIKKIRTCIKDQKPDFICMEEVLEKDIISFAQEFNYYYIHASKFISKQTGEGEGQGILSKYKILESKKQRYDINPTKDTPIFDTSLFLKSKPKRPQEQFLFHEILLSVKVQLNSKILTIATTHFPVSDLTSPGLHEHELFDIDSLNYVQNMRNYFDRFLKQIKTLKRPLIFTSDLNNPRGDFIYDALAHELVDQIPKDINSSIDPKLHRVKKLKLMVDTVMASEGINNTEVKVIEGISDHKGFLMNFEF
jgi:hypothetical protein